MYHAALIGINDFQGSDSDLRGCINDVQDIGALLSPDTRKTTVIGKLPFFHNFDSITYLKDKQATLKRAVETVGTLLDKLGDDDFGFLWFSQHGSNIKDKDGDEIDGNDEVFCFSDFGLLTDDAFRKLVLTRNPKSKLFVGTDLCNSGTVHRMYVPKRSKPFSHRIRCIPPEQLPARALKNVSTKDSILRKVNQGANANMIHFAGCQDPEYCYDATFKGRPNGAFTFYMLKALGTLQKGATFGDWFKAVGEYLPSVEYNQTPKCNASAKMLSLPIPCNI